MSESSDTHIEKEKEYIVDGWCAFNKGGKPPIDEISFEESKDMAVKHWLDKNQEIRKCRVIIYEK